MKKGFVLGFAALVLLTGCGNKVKCTNGDTTYVATIKNDKLTKLTATEKYKTKDEANKSCKQAKAAKEFYGDEMTVKCSGKKVSATLKPKKAEKMTKKEFKEAYCK